MTETTRRDVPFNLRQRAGRLRRQLDDMKLRARTLRERIALCEAELAAIERETAPEQAEQAR